ncbi:4-hydroxybenzoate 3-monooxygenase [Actinoplanes sp. NPDC089786]|uniref:4-hydroxybenzoate 3-monooxygenase n=1 Tax=Actinoplanes sp. NPDC089786 TaxID=3155185 RepID=UPI0034251D5F
MSEAAHETTTVAIIGAGPAGLTLANLLRTAGVDCVVVERQSRAYVEQRQRAGVLEHRAARMFEEWGLADRVLQDSRTDGVQEFRVDGRPRFLPIADLAGGKFGRILPQQFLVQRLITAFQEDGGDLRFGCQDVTLERPGSERPVVTYRDEDGRPHEIEADYLAGCDGFHGVSRRSVPEAEQTIYAYDHGIGWFTVLADVPPPRHPMFAVSAHGFAAHFPRGPRSSRFYLQCAPGEDLDAWDDRRIFDQLRLRIGDPDLPAGAVLEKAVVDMRSFVVDPMSYGRLFLVGDAAHIITPMGGKGMNLALADAEVLAKAVRSAVRDGDAQPLRDYSKTCLDRTWSYQEFSRWMTEMLHDSGDPATSGPFRHKIARARLDRLFTSPNAGGLFSDLMAGEA